MDTIELEKHYLALPIGSAERKAGCKAYMESLPCTACWHNKNPTAPITDTGGQCHHCHAFMNTIYIHTCMNKEGVCGRCNTALKQLKRHRDQLAA